MATVVRVRNKYRAQIRLKGRSLSRTFTHRRDAELWAADQERGIVAGRGGGGIGRGWSLHDLIARYLRDLCRASVCAIPAARSRNSRGGRVTIGHVKLVDVTPALISEARDRLLREPTHRGTARSGATTNRYLAALGGALKAGVRRYHCVDSSPMKDVEKEREADTIGRALSADEIKLLLAAVEENDPELRVAILFAVTTACRRGELERLRWCDLDLARGRASFLRTKNGEARTVGVPAVTVAALRDWQRLTNAIGQARVCVTQGDWLYRRLVAAATRAGLGDLRFHDLRHSALTLMARNGATLVELAQTAGHKTLHMVMRYQHLASDVPRSAADRAAAAFD
jgi:integrase